MSVLVLSDKAASFDSNVLTFYGKSYRVGEPLNFIYSPAANLSTYTTHQSCVTEQNATFPPNLAK